MHRPSLIDVQNSLCQFTELPVSIHRTPCVNSQNSLRQFTEATWSKHRTLLVRAQGPPPPPLPLCQCTEAPFSLPRAPLFIVQNPIHINAPCWLATYPSCVLKLTHSQSACGRQSGPTVALWQTSMALPHSAGHKNTQPIWIICFLPSQILSTPAMMLACS